MELIKGGIILKLETKQLEEIRAERGRRNLTIGALTKEVGVSRSTMGNIINGKTDGLNTATFNKITAWLNDAYKEVAK